MFSVASAAPRLPSVIALLVWVRWVRFPAAPDICPVEVDGRTSWSLKDKHIGDVGSRRAGGVDDIVEFFVKP